MGSNPITLDNVLRASVDYDYPEFVPEGQPKWGNTPNLRFEMDCELPTHGDYRYEMREGLYFAVQYPFAHFIYKKDPTVPDKGFGGRTSNLKMKDGTEVKFSGGWATRPSVANSVEFPACLDVSCKVPSYKSLHFATNILVPFAAQILERFLPEWELALSGQLDKDCVLMEVRHVLKRKGMPLKSPDNWGMTKRMLVMDGLSSDQHTVVTS